MVIKNNVCVIVRYNESGQYWYDIGNRGETTAKESPLTLCQGSLHS